jgi:hypothetical protein
MKVSIIIGNYNRKLQLFYTLLTIKKSLYKNIEIIIIDDCSDIPEEQINEADFKNFFMNIKLIKIKREEKTWVNPCVIYNKGINASTGDIIILQNSEVCHIGDCISYVVNNLRPNDWLTFNCYGLNNFNDNRNIYLMKNNQEIYNYINKIWNEKKSYNIKPGGNNAFNNDVGGWLNHYLIHFTAYHYFGAIFRNDLITKMNGGFDLDYSNGICFDDNDFVKRLIYNNIRFTINSFSELEPFVIHLFHEKAKNLIENKDEKWNHNKIIYDQKCKNMNITNDWRLCNFMPNPHIINKDNINFSNLNMLVVNVLNEKSDLSKIKSNLLEYLNQDTIYLNIFAKDVKLNILFFISNNDNKKIKEYIDFWKNYNFIKNYIKNIYIINEDNKQLELNKIYDYINDLTIKLYINKDNDIKIYPNNLIKNLKLWENYYITKNTNLLELQIKFLKFRTPTNINIIFDKKKFTKEMNTFRKCILKRHFYKNSQLKIPSNLNFKILYKK